MAHADEIDVNFDSDADKLELNLERNFRLIRDLLSLHFSDSTTASNTDFLLFDVDNGQFERVTVGAADSAGIGFKQLRIPN